MVYLIVDFLIFLKQDRQLYMEFKLSDALLEFTNDASMKVYVVFDIETVF